MAARATFALKAAVWFRRSRLLMVSPVRGYQAETPLIGLFKFARPALSELVKFLCNQFDTIRPLPYSPPFNTPASGIQHEDATLAVIDLLTIMKLRSFLRFGTPLRELLSLFQRNLSRDWSDACFGIPGPGVCATSISSVPA
jgi:hypothetical protein